MPVKPERLAIVKYPAPVLRKRAAPVGAVTDEVAAVAGRMIELMHDASGVGLAAPQVGVSWRLFVTHDPESDEGDRVFVDPVLSEPSDELVPREEGCLSIPGVNVEVRRPAAITIEATDLAGRRFTLRGDQLAARIWQHESDHLDGVLILDRMSPADRLANQRAIRELEQAAAAAARR